MVQRRVRYRLTDILHGHLDLAHGALDGLDVDALAADIFNFGGEVGPGLLSRQRQAHRHSHYTHKS